MRAVTVRRASRSRGQSLAEFALMLPFLALLITGSAQFGALFYSNITLDTAAREGARVASLQPNASGAYQAGAPQALGTTCQLYKNSPDLSNPACDAVWNASGLFAPSTAGQMTATIVPDGVPSGAAIVNCQTYDSSSYAGNTQPQDGYVKVTVTYKVPIFVPLLGQMLSDAGSGNSIRTVTSSVEMRVAPCSITGG